LKAILPLRAVGLGAGAAMQGTAKAIPVAVTKAFTHFMEISCMVVVSADMRNLSTKEIGDRAQLSI